MSTDNRTTLNDCSAITGWTGDDAVAVNTDTGNFYEGSSALSSQFSNADEHMFTTSIGGTRDLSDSTCWMLIKDNLVSTKVLGGIKYVLSDGTDTIGYEVGGNDDTGLQLNIFYNSYRLDVSNSAAFTAHAFAGSEAALGKTVITGVGYGTIHLSKAVGSIDNCFMDRFSFIANGSPALTINGGTSGTPETLTDVAGDDITSGWGLVANPQGSLFNIFCATEWGDSGTASSYFEQLDSQIFMNGNGLSVGNFDMALIANTTGTNLFRLDNCVVVGIGAVANWDFTSVNVNTMEILGCQFVDAGTIDFPVTGGTSRKCTDTTFVNCGQVNPSTMTFTGNSFVGTTDANGAILLGTSLTDCSFTSDGTGHAIYITSIGTYTLTDVLFSGYGATTSTDAVIYNNSGGAVTINVTGGDTPTYRNGASATTTVNVSVSVTVTVVDQTNTPVNLAQVSVHLTSDDSEVLNGDTNASGIATTSFSGVTPAGCYIRVRKSSTGTTRYFSASTTGTIASGTGLSTTIVIRADQIVSA